MAFRSDIIVRWHYDPRIVIVQQPSTEVTIQDLYDTLRELEQEQINLVHNSIIRAAGKEELGGGVLVGLTANLLNAQITFEPRVIAITNGTVTTGNSGGITLIDNSATFVADGVSRGDLISNQTDSSRATVLSVDSETQITTDILKGGSDNQFEIGDLYSIFEIIQCNISGGNLVATDSDGLFIDPVLPSFGTQIVRTSSSSATLQELQDIQFSSFNGAVTVDNINGVAGTVFPTGTARQPVKSLSDAIIISQSRGIDTFKLLQDITIDSGINYTNKRFIGESPTDTQVVVDTNAIVNDCTFIDMDISGVLDGFVTIKSCRINSLTAVDGLIESSALYGTITLSGVNDITIVDCYDGVPSGTSPIIDCGGAGSNVVIRNWRGGITFTNKTGSEDVSIDLIGRVVLDNTVTNGTFTIRGVGELIDNSTGTTVDSSNLVSPTNIDEVLTANHGSGTWTTSDLTPLTQWKILQLWVDDPTNSRIRGEFALIKNGLKYEAAAGSTASIQLFVDGSLAYTIAGISKDANGFYRANIGYSSFNTSSGTNIVSVVTITDGVDSYQGATGIARVAFTQ